MILQFYGHDADESVVSCFSFLRLGMGLRGFLQCSMSFFEMWIIWGWRKNLLYLIHMFLTSRFTCFCHAEERSIYTRGYAILEVSTIAQALIYHWSFKKSHLGLIVFINATFLALVHPFSSFSLAMAFVTYWNCSM